jgi:cytosine/adenosine deaminase-related metal-dependent hydrolase
MISLHNVYLINEGLRQIDIENGKIVSIKPEAGGGVDSQTTHLHFDQSLAFPGLINSHDHLHFDCFPRMGNRIYSDYVDWGADIHHANRGEIDSILKIPTPFRTQWGLYKNLLNGITTVVHHGEYLAVTDPVVDVFQQCNMLHSVRQERRWRWRLNKPFAGRRPFVVHAGEGTNLRAHREIDSLIRWNLLKRELIAVHGIAMDERQAARFRALIWCPDSNYFLFNRTADIPHLRQKTTILFGTDSTLSASWNIWDQLRSARRLGMISDEALFNAVTRAPAAVWRMEGKGTLRVGSQADLVAANRKSPVGDYASWFETTPADIALVVQNGAVRLCDEDRFRQLQHAGSACATFSRVSLEGSVRYVCGNLTGLLSAIKAYAPQAVFPLQSAD